MSLELASAPEPLTAQATPGDPAAQSSAFVAVVPIDVTDARPALVTHLAAALAADWRRRRLAADQV